MLFRRKAPREVPHSRFMHGLATATVIVAGLLKLGCDAAPVEQAAPKTEERTPAASTEEKSVKWSPPDIYDLRTAKTGINQNRKIAPSDLKGPTPRIPLNVFRQMVCDGFAEEGQTATCADDLKAAVVRDNAIGAESAAFTLMDDTRCIKFLGDLFGIGLPEPSRSVFMHWLMAAKPGERQFSLGSEGGVTTFKTPESYAAFLRFVAEHEELYAKQPCLNGHEMTHVFVGTTPIPLWANEGLANFVEKRIATIGLVSNVTCTDTSWISVGEEKPFEDLTKPYTAQNQASWYNTGLCFWDYIERTYGRTALIQIVQELKKYEGANPNQVDFLRDIVGVVVGADVTVYTGARFRVQ